MVYILRNNQTFGPYSHANLKVYIEEGKILMNDIAKENNEVNFSTVRQIIKKHKIKLKIKSNGTIIHQIKLIGSSLIFPKLNFIKNDLFKDKKLINLAFIGLAPAFLIRFTFSSYITFYAIALYFSAIWAIFFNSLFKTRQVSSKTTIVIYFLAQLAALTLVNLQVVPPFNFLYHFTNSSSVFQRLIGFVLGVGLLEEFIKALPLYYLILKAKEPIIPQTLVFYGLMSGIGFGVFEGVQYQTTFNSELQYNEAFFMNIARLTTLPFLHAIWASISGYFISFANLYPLNRYSLISLAIIIPATLHGLYDLFGWSILGLIITVISVLLLVYYLKKAHDYQTKLISL